MYYPFCRDLVLDLLRFFPCATLKCYANFYHPIIMNLDFIHLFIFFFGITYD